MNSIYDIIGETPTTYYLYWVPLSILVMVVLTFIFEKMFFRPFSELISYPGTIIIILIFSIIPSVNAIITLFSLPMIIIIIITYIICIFGFNKRLWSKDK